MHVHRCGTFSQTRRSVRLESNNGVKQSHLPQGVRYLVYYSILLEASAVTCSNAPLRYWIVLGRGLKRGAHRGATMIVISNDSERVLLPEQDGHPIAVAVLSSKRIGAVASWSYRT
jgi:hypothetical protein